MSATLRDSKEFDMIIKAKQYLDANQHTSRETKVSQMQKVQPCRYCGTLQKVGQYMR